MAENSAVNTKVLECPTFPLRTVYVMTSRWIPQTQTVNNHVMCYVPEVNRMVNFLRTIKTVLKDVKLIKSLIKPMFTNFLSQEVRHHC